QPQSVVQMTVSSINGKIPSAHALSMNRTNTDWFNRKFVPTQEDDSFDTFKYVKYKGLNYLPSDTTPQDMIKEKVFFKRESNVYELLSKIKTSLEEMPEEYKPKRNNRFLTVEDYYPDDLALTAPSVQLPAAENDGPPKPPTGLNAKKDNNTSYQI